MRKGWRNRVHKEGFEARYVVSVSARSNRNLQTKTMALRRSPWGITS